jgi:cytochrome c biogenesis protein CcdA
VIDLVVLVVSIALVDSLNPATVMPALYLATAPRPVRAILGFAAGFFAVNVAGGIVALGLGHRLAGVVPRPGADLQHWVELVTGVAAILASGILWRSRDRVNAGFARMQLGAHRMAPLAGAALAVIELPTSLPYFAAIAALAASDQPAAVQISLLVLFQVIFLAPVVAIAAVRALAGPRAVEALARVRAFVLRYAGAAVAALVLGLGIALVVLGGVGVSASG